MRTTQAFAFSGLTKEQQQVAFDSYREDFQPNEYWHIESINHFEEVLESVGFSDVEVYFSGFWSQGDGASFVGNYAYKEGALGKVLKEYPAWDALHDLVRGLQEASRREFYSVSFHITRSGRYCHEYSTAFDFEDRRTRYGNVRDSFDESAFVNLCRSFMRDIYKYLMDEYNYLCSFECVSECPEYYDYLEFELDENGKPVKL